MRSGRESGAPLPRFESRDAYPFSSNTKPCVSTALYGATPCAATDVRSDDWNQPRCWSLPSRYMSTSPGLQSSSGRVCATDDHDEPESNHTSIVSVPL